MDYLFSSGPTMMEPWSRSPSQELFLASCSETSLSSSQGHHQAMLPAQASQGHSSLQEEPEVTSFLIFA